MNLILFDLDDSLIAGDSEKAWIDFLQKKGLIVDSYYLKKIDSHANEYKEGRLDIQSYVLLLLEPIKGRSVQDISRYIKPFSELILDRFSDRVTQTLLQKHSEDFCLVVSGTLTFLVKEISSLLGVNTYFGTDPEIRNGIYTGEILGEPNFGQEKVRRIKSWIQENQIDSSLYKIAYSDSVHDLPLLEFADLPTVVNPDKKLKEISSKRGWKTIERSR